MLMPRSGLTYMYLVTLVENDASFFAGIIINFIYTAFGLKIFSLCAQNSIAEQMS